MLLIIPMDCGCAKETVLEFKEYGRTLTSVDVRFYALLRIKAWWSDIKDTKFTVIYGHYGSGKTNLALNLAMDAAAGGQKVAIADLDIVNPYFRTGDYVGLLESHGIKTLATGLSGTTVDVPAITAEMYSMFSGIYDRVIIDVGGDDAGAYALGRFSKNLKESENCEVLYVINKYRALISDTQSAVAILKEIEAASSVMATGIVNNSHLCGETCAGHIMDSLDYATDVSKDAGLPLVFTTVPKRVEGELVERLNAAGMNFKLYPVDVIVKPPFSFD